MHLLHKWGRWVTHTVQLYDIIYQVRECSVCGRKKSRQVF